MRSHHLNTWRGSRLLLAALAVAGAVYLAHSAPESTRLAVTTMAASLLAGPTDPQPAETFVQAAMQRPASRHDGQL